MAKSSKTDFPTVEGVHIISLIGKGNFSRVFKGVDLVDKEKVAVKVIDKNDLTKGKADDIVSEIGIMKSLNHPHVVRMRDFKWDSKAVYIILEYCEGGNLYEYIKLHNRLREHVCKRALQQLASGLAYLRSKNLCHMDLKPQNILMNFDPFTLKIADFGLAQYVPDKIYKENLRGSPLYMAPEILFAKKYNSKVDLWSVGVILYECLFGRAPFAHKNCQELLNTLKQETPIKFPSTIPVSQDCKDLLKGLLVYDPEERISYDDFFSHPFIDLVHAPTDENKKLVYKILQDAVILDEKKDYVKAFNLYCRGLRYLVPLLDTMSASEERAYIQLKISEYLNRAEELKMVLYKEDNYHEMIKEYLNEENPNILNEKSSLIRRYLSKGKSEDQGSSSLMEKSSVSSKDSGESSTHSLSGASAVLSSCSLSSQGSQDHTMPLVNETIDEGTSTKPSFHDTIKTSPETMIKECSPQELKGMFACSPKVQDALDIGFVAQMYMIQSDYEIAYKKYEISLGILIPQLKYFTSGVRRDILVYQIKKWLAQAESAKTLASAKTINCSENTKTGVEVMGNYNQINGLHIQSSVQPIGIFSLIFFRKLFYPVIHLNEFLNYLIEILNVFVLFYYFELLFALIDLCYHT